MKTKYLGKKKIYDTLKEKGYKLPPMKEMEYDKYHGTEILRSHFESVDVYAHLKGACLSVVEKENDEDGVRRREKSLKVYRGQNFDLSFATKYGKVTVMDGKRVKK